MKEIKYNGNIFLLPKTVKDACLVTTNGIVRRDGKAVMGAGIAKYCRDTFIGVDKRLGSLIKRGGNHVYYLGQMIGISFMPSHNSAFQLLSFPTKDDWKEDSKPELIQQSCQEIVKFADEHDLENIYMPCPGCSNGRLNYWEDVRPILLKELDDRFTVCIPNRIMSRLSTEVEIHERL